MEARRHSSVTRRGLVVACVAVAVTLLPTAVSATGVPAAGVAAAGPAAGATLPAAATPTVNLATATMPTVNRLAGATRYDTAVAISKQAFPTGNRPPVVFLVSGTNYPDALSAAPAAAVLGGTTLITAPGALTPVIETELRRLAPERVVILGGLLAISAAVESRVRTFAPVERIGGADRYETSRLVAQYAFGEVGSKRAWIATGLNYPDGLAAGAAAGANGAPLVLVRGQDKAIDGPTVEFLSSLGADDFVLAGGELAISAGIEQSLSARIPGASVYRAGGATRYDTARMLVENGFPNLPPGRAFLGTGVNFPDALVAAAYAARLGRPLLLTSPMCVHSSVRPMLQGPSYTSLTLLGGPLALRGLVDTLTPCQSISAGNSLWAVVNKHRPYNPARYVPSGLVTPNVPNPGGHRLRSDAAAAARTMFNAAESAGAGRMSIASGYRSYDTQAQVYNTRLRERGRAYADAWIARPGFSEHQSGLSLDIAPVGASGCAVFNCLGNTPQGRWLATNSWRYGFILRYPAGQTAVTGYNPEPWHFRYVGVPLATDYYRDGWKSLEAYAGLPPAPNYRG